MLACTTIDAFDERELLAFAIHHIIVIFKDCFTKISIKSNNPKPIHVWPLPEWMRMFNFICFHGEKKQTVEAQNSTGDLEPQAQHQKEENNMIQ